MTTGNSQPPHGPGHDGQDGGQEGGDWEDEFGFGDRQFVVEDLTDDPEPPLPPAVTGAPPAPQEPGASGQPRAQ
ncbi:MULTISPECIES: hypothetical protein [unclassified Streptomyces]|uniref:hypothetical protein n=1 Tax=unclassified Streptomyces TaxID=2593676 RepID=UPI00339F5A8C